MSQGANDFESVSALRAFSGGSGNNVSVWMASLTRPPGGAARAGTRRQDRRDFCNRDGPSPPWSRCEALVLWRPTSNTVGWLLSVLRRLPARLERAGWDHEVQGTGSHVVDRAPNHDAARKVAELADSSDVLPYAF